MATTPMEAAQVRIQLGYIWRLPGLSRRVLAQQTRLRACGDSVRVQADQPLQRAESSSREDEPRGRVSGEGTAEGCRRDEHTTPESERVPCRWPPVRGVLQLDAACWVTETRRSHEFI
jgi:hypothetical protein